MTGASGTLRLADGVATALAAHGGPVAVIGPSGWLGSAALAMLDHAFPDDDLAGRVSVFGSHARPVVLPSGRVVACREMAALPGADLAGALLLHFAYLTKDKTRDMSVEAYLAANDAIQAPVLRAVAGGAPRGLFFASSGAVYAASVSGGRAGGPTREGDPYGWQKRRHEAAFADAAARAGVACTNGRIFSVAGEHINKVELYALGSILSMLKAGGPVRLHAAREVWRSYAYVGDVINLALALMLAGHAGTLDIAGDEPVEVGALARLCAAAVGRPDAVILRPPLGPEPPDRMLGDPTAFTALMAREGIAPLPLAAQVAATAAFLGSRVEADAPIG